MGAAALALDCEKTLTALSDSCRAKFLKPQGPSPIAALGAMARQGVLLKIGKLAAQMKTLETHPLADATFGYNEAIRSLYEFSALTRSLESIGVPPSDILETVQPIREVLSRSPFINHLQTWPHGYQGDYEIVEHIMDVVNKSPLGFVGVVLGRSGAPLWHSSTAPK